MRQFFFKAVLVAVFVLVAGASNAQRVVMVFQQATRKLAGIT